MQEFKRYAILFKNSAKLQFGLSFIIYALFLLYFFAYSLDLINMYSAVATNDISAQLDEDNDELFIVENLVKIDDEKFKIETGNKGIAMIPSVNYNDLIYNCKYKDGKFVYELETGGGISCSFDTIISNINTEDDVIRYSINNDYIDYKDRNNLKLDEESILYSVYCLEDGYRIDYPINGEIISYTTDNIVNIKLQKDYKKKEYKKLLVDNNFEKIITSTDTKYCTELKTDDIYYSVSADVLLQNLDKDYWEMFAESESMPMVTMCICTFLVFFIIAFRFSDFVLYRKRIFADITFMFLVAIPILLFFTYVLLGVRYE